MIKAVTAALPILAAIILLLCSCTDVTPPTPTRPLTTCEDMTETGTPSVPNHDMSKIKTDIDLSVEDPQMAFVFLSNMMMTPDDYKGKTVKMSGTFAHTQENGKDFFVCYIMDNTLCCSQSLEFVIDGEYSFPEDYPPEKCNITVAGTFDTYEYNGYEMFRLLNAKISYP